MRLRDGKTFWQRGKPFGDLAGCLGRYTGPADALGDPLEEVPQAVYGHIFHAQYVIGDLMQRGYIDAVATAQSHECSDLLLGPIL